MIAAPASTPRLLPLHELHATHGACWEPFAGWSMPIHYPLGILGEHHHTRAGAGLFDVSHMGQIVLRSKSDDPADTARALESLLPTDLVGLPAGRQRYAFLTQEAGGIRDDLMAVNLGDRWHLVVNAACAAADLAYLEDRLSAACRIEMLTNQVLLAIQGPAAAAALATIVPGVAAMRFMDAAVFAGDGGDVLVTRSGYTGEDGFEMSGAVDAMRILAAGLLALPPVRLIGLGARDSLRLEAGLCLYGHDLDTDTTPVEAGLEWAIPRVRRAGGPRAGGFPGAPVILAQLESGTTRRRVGLCAGARPVRAGVNLFADAASTRAVGQVTSGTYGPSAGRPVAMGYVMTAHADTGTVLYAEVRGQRLPATLCDMPFVPHRYHR